METDRFIEQLREEYDNLNADKRDLRRKVRESYQAQIEREIERQSRILEADFASRLVEARASGRLKRKEITWIIRTGTSSKFDYYMELGGWSGMAEEVTLDEVDEWFDLFEMHVLESGLVEVTVKADPRTREPHKPFRAAVSTLDMRTIDRGHIRYFVLLAASIPAELREIWADLNSPQILTDYMKSKGYDFAEYRKLESFV